MSKIFHGFSWWTKTETVSLQASKEANGALTADLGDLLALDDEATPATEANPATANNYLHDLLSDAAPPAATSQSAAADLLDLLGGPQAPPHTVRARPLASPSSLPLQKFREPIGGRANLASLMSCKGTLPRNPCDREHSSI